MSLHITVREASAYRAGYGTVGFGIIDLHVARNANADYEDRVVETRALTAAALKVAAELEGIAAAEHLECDISFARARQGVIMVDFRSDGFGVDAIDEILMDACGHCGFGPEGM
jgi:hypothetical protein